jgi:ABC-type branched-subunit amino acid transport system substrate-binding protein
MRVRGAHLAGLLAATALAAAAAGCGGENRPVRIGLLTDCRAFFAGYEEAMLAGAELPLLRRGGRLSSGKPAGGVTGARVAGREIELVRGCSETLEHTVLVEEARRLVEVEQVDAVVGPIGEVEALVMRELARKHPTVVFLPAWYGSQELTLRRPAPNVFRFTADEAQDVAGLGTYAHRDLGWRRAAVVSDSYSIGWHQEAAFAAEFCALGGSIVHRSNSAAEFLEALEKNPSLLGRVDGVAVLTTGIFGSPSELLTRLANAPGQASRRIVVGSYVIEDPSIVSPVAAAIDGVVGASPIPPVGSTAVMRRHRREFARVFPGLPPGFAAGPIVLGYHDPMEGLLRGLEAAGADLSNGRARLREELGRVQIDVPGGPVRLDRNRQAVRNVYLKQIVSGAKGAYSLRLVRVVPEVEQTFGGLLSRAPSPGPGSQPCTRATPPPWSR